MKLLYEKGLFIFQCHVTDNDLARRVGLNYDTDRKAWVTPWIGKARKVLDACDNREDALAAIAHREQDQKYTYSLSTSLASTYQVPLPKGRELRGYQRAGVEFIVERNGGLIADEMGLGKTVQAICACNVIRPKRVLIVCPSTVKQNWVIEWKRWTTLPLTIGITTSAINAGTDVEVINYDIAFRKKEYLRDTKWDVVIFDESHRLKNNNAQRTIALFGGVIIDNAKRTRIYVKPLRASVRICMSGSPILNRPIEIFPTLRYLLPSGFPDKMAFARRYCNMKHTGFGMDMNGSSNEEELQKLLRSTVMIRRMKAEVLTELPPKVRQIIEIDPTTKIKAALKKFADFAIPGELEAGEDLLDEGAYTALVRTMSGARVPSFEEIAALRKEEAIELIPLVLDHLDDILDSKEKVVVFFHHNEVGERIKEHFGDSCVLMYGKTPIPQRQGIVDKFQNDPNCRVFAGNLQTAGVAITLTASDHVVCAEYPWTPGDLTQAEDRCHRFGQTKTVLVQHLAFRGSLGATMLKYIVGKQTNIDKILNQKLDPRLIELLK